MAITPDNEQLIVLVSSADDSDLLVLDYDNSSGELSSPELLGSTAHLDQAEEFLVAADGSHIYAIITANDLNEDGQLIIFDRSADGEISYSYTREGDSSGIKKPIDLAQSPDGKYLFISGQLMTNQTTAVSAISVFNAQSSLYLLDQYYQNIPILANADVHIVVGASTVALYSAAGELALYTYNPETGSMSTVAILTLEELVNSGSRERGIAGMAAGAFGGDFFYTAGSDSHAIGSIKIQ